MSKGINPITGSPDRSTEAYTESGKPASKAMIEADVLSRPLGSMPGDPIPGVARNSRPPTAIYFARNLSNQVKRKVLVGKAVSAAQHIDEKVQQKYHMDGATIKEAVNMGTGDFNTYDMKVEPVDKVLMADSQRFVIRCSRTEGEPGEWTPITEALYEIWLGNWERRNHADEQTRREELRRISNTNDGSSPVFEEGTARNEVAYIEFRREEILTAPVAADREKIYAGMKVEI